MAKKPKGSLTGSQFEILELFWDSKEGKTVADIWQSVQETRSISRTTILNQVDRLEKRGWLSRKKVDGVFHYFATVTRDSTEHQLTSEFLDDFFSGSTSNFLLSLLGPGRVSKKEAADLKRILSEQLHGSKENHRKERDV